jgi:hypothetical protein
MSSSLIQIVELGLTNSLDKTLVHELIGAYVEAKRNFYLGGLRLSEVEGGRFCEAAFRLLQVITTGKFTPLGKQLDTEKIRDQLGNLPSINFSESLRIHIPRALRVVYDIRNKRNAAHLADGIDPNTQDATLVVSVLDWVLAEFVRLYHTVSANEAQRIVESLVTRRAPAVQEFGGFLKILNPGLQASDHMLLLLYQRGKEGAYYAELFTWARQKMKANLKRTLEQLVDDRAFVHYDGAKYFVTESGIRDVELRRLYQMPAPG